MRSAIITTERLYLEKIRKKHFEDLYSLLSNKEVQKYFPSTLSREETRNFYGEIQKRYKDDGFCFLAVIRKQDDAFIGICGLLKQEIDNKVETEIGYRFLNEYWGNGFATEAVKGCVRYVKENKLFKKLIILSIPQNTPSIEVAGRAGFSYLKDTVFHDLTHNIYMIEIGKMT